MLDFRLEVTGDPLRAWGTQLAAIERTFPDDNGPLLRKLAEVLEYEHKASFKRGYRLRDRPWPETDAEWAARERGKPGVKPLVWTGDAERSIQAQVKGQSVEVLGEDYLEKFEPGKTRGHVPMYGPHYVAFNDEPPTHFKKINRKVRHIFDATQEDADWAMFQLAPQAGLEPVITQRWSRVI